MSNIMFSVLCVLFFLSTNYSQENPYDFDFQQIAGELIAADLTKETIGRYDGFEIPLYKGEIIQFLLYSEEFNPVLILAAPNGNTFQQSIGEKYKFAKISAEIPEDGNYYLYVVSEKRSLGKYYLQNAIGSEKSFKIPENVGFCDEVKYILAHARAAFQLLSDEGKSGGILDGSLKSYFDNEIGSYNAVMYEGKTHADAEKIFLSIKTQFDSCLGKDWLFESKVWSTDGNYKYQDNIYSGKDNLGNNLQINLRYNELQNVNIDPTRPVKLEIIFRIVRQ